MKNVFEEINEFLEYFGKNSSNQKKREKENLIKTFGKEKFERVFNLCFENSRFVGYDMPLKEKNWAIHVKPEGLKFLGEENHKKVMQEHNKTILYLTTILVLTTILAAFLGIKLTNTFLLITIYGIFAILIWFYFKKSNTIKI